MSYSIRNASDFGGAVRALRTENGLTQSDLARRAGVGRQWISDVESGKSGLRFTTILALLDALNIDLTLRPRDTPSINLDDLLGPGPPPD